MNQKFHTPVIVVGFILPALMSLFFIFQFGFETEVGDEWELVPILESFHTGKPWLYDLMITQHNEHRPFFPRLVILEISPLTMYNTFYEIILGWTLLVLTLVLIWRLLLQTISEVKWIIIPIAWVTFSLYQFENFLWGSPSVAWHLTILSVIATIYFLTKIKNSSIAIIPVIIFGFVASFSLAFGLLVWVVGLISFRGLIRTKPILFISYIISGILAYSLFFNGWKGRLSSQTSLIFDDPLRLVGLIFSFFSIGPRQGLSIIENLDVLIISATVGIIIVSIFIIMSFLYLHFQIGRTTKITIVPWVQIAIFGLLSGIAIGVTRFSFGDMGSITSRYSILSNLFLVGTFVIFAVVLVYMMNNAKTVRHKKILKYIFIIFMILLILGIGTGYVAGWFGGIMFSERIDVGASCLKNFESASDDCLQILYPDIDILRERAQILQNLCLGPFITCN